MIVGHDEPRLLAFWNIKTKQNMWFEAQSFISNQILNTLTQAYLNVTLSSNCQVSWEIIKMQHRHIIEHIRSWILAEPSVITWEKKLLTWDNEPRRLGREQERRCFQCDPKWCNAAPRNSKLYRWDNRSGHKIPAVWQNALGKSRFYKNKNGHVSLKVFKD